MVLKASSKQLDEIVVNANRVTNDQGMAFANVKEEDIKKLMKECTNNKINIGYVRCGKRYKQNEPIVDSTDNFIERFFVDN